jgi:hypothetical protein
MSVIFDDLCYVVTITACHGGAFVAGEAIRFGSLQSAVDECESLQSNFDADCEPRRAYVVGADEVPVWAGRARGKPPLCERAERNASRGRLLFSNSIA